MLKLIRKVNFSSVREKMEYDVLIVGAGPAGLASFFKLFSLIFSCYQT